MKYCVSDINNNFIREIVCICLLIPLILVPVTLFFIYELVHGSISGLCHGARNGIFIVKDLLRAWLGGFDGR